MTIAKPKMFSFAKTGAVINAARALLNAAEAPLPRAPIATPQPAGPDIDPFHQDRSRYARLLEKELDRRILTQVEREDTDTLNRVRSALYAAD